MATLVELKDAIEAGETVQEGDSINGYHAVFKRGDIYIEVYDFDETRYATFDALCTQLDGLEYEWEIQPEPTAEEAAYWKPFADALDAKDEGAAVAFFRQHMDTRLEEHKEEMLVREANGRTRYTVAACEVFVNDGKIVRCVNKSAIAIYRWKEHIVLAIDGVQQFFTTFPDVVAQVAKLSYIDYVGHLTQRATWYVAEDSKSFEILGSPVALEV